MRKTIMSLAGLGLLGAALIAPGPASASPLAYNRADIAPAVLHEGEVTEGQSYTGQDVTVSSSGTETYAYRADNGKYVAKPTTSINFASASLASASLKSRTYLGFGANLPYDDSVYAPSMDYGHNFSHTGANVSFGDSFQTYSENSPFLWSDGTNASFHFAISGDAKLPSVIADTIGTPLERTSNTQIFSVMSINIYKTGTLDLIRQMNEISSGPIDDATWAQYMALNQQVNDNQITRQYWYLGQPVGTFGDGSLISDDMGANLEHFVSLDDGPAVLDFAFTPGGDFDWDIQFNTTVRLDTALENTFVDFDFSHTIVTTYNAPDGATTYSASGLFPGTLALSSAPGSGVPEPASWLLMIAGIGLLGSAARKRDATPILA